MGIVGEMVKIENCRTDISQIQITTEKFKNETITIHFLLYQVFYLFIYNLYLYNVTFSVAKRAIFKCNNFVCNGLTSSSKYQVV